MRDFVNFTPETCLHLMLEYQKTEDYEIFHALLARYDRFILDVIFKFQRKVWSLKEEELQELYHIGILGFVKCILAVKEDFVAEYLCNRIRSYIISELRQTYLHPNREKIMAEYVLLSDEHSDVDTFKKNLSVKLLLESSILSESDKNLLKRHYFDGKTTYSIGKELNLSQPAIVKRLRKARQKIKDNLYK